MRQGVYRSECSSEGSMITRSMTIRAQGGDSVVLNCLGGAQGRVLNLAAAAASTLTLVGLKFANTKSMGSGGAIFASRGAALVVRDCSFENCQSLAHAGPVDSLYQGGGAIFVEGTGALAVEGSSFTECQAPHGAGGAILIGVEDDGLVRGCVLSDADKVEAVIQTLQIAHRRWHRQGGVLAQVPSRNVA